MLTSSNTCSLNNFDFLARDFVRMQVEDHPTDIQAITEDMDEGHRSWFRKRCALYYQQATEARELELEH